MWVLGRLSRSNTKDLQYCYRRSSDRLTVAEQEGYEQLHEQHQDHTDDSLHGILLIDILS